LVQFNDTSYSYPDVIVSWAWNFGDGGTSTLQNPSHAYGDNGFYPVTLIVTDDDGSVSSIMYYITILNVAPSVNAGSNQTADEGSMVFFSGSFTDPGWLDTHTYYWDFGDGGTAFGTLNTSHAYGDNGLYIVTLTVTDDDGGVGVGFVAVIVNNVAPTVFAAVDQEMDEGLMISLTLASFWDPGWLDTHIATIDWGDGTVEPGIIYGGSSNGTVSGSHMYGDDGVFEVIVYVEDDDGGVGSDTLTVTVYNVVPYVELYSESIVDENTLLDLGCLGTDPGSDDLTFTWEFELGPTVINIHYNDGVGPDPYPSTNLNPMNVTDWVSHTYGDNGIFLVTVTVEDDDGGLVVMYFNVTVNNVAPQVDIAGPFEVDENSPLTLNCEVYDPGSDDITLTWELELGPSMTTIYYNDGSGPDPYPSPEVNPRDIMDLVSHTYGDNGIFLFKLTAEDDDGGITVHYMNITVNNVAPSVLNIEAFMYVNFTLRVAGEKWHSVGVRLLEDDSEVWAATVTRYPGDPDEQTATISGVKVDMTKSYTALVDYLPNDPRVNGNVWGGNPVWIITDFEDGTQERLHHTFNVRQSDWGSDHWNHIDPWEVDFTPQLSRQNITFESSASDVGSDDLTFLWDFDDGNTSGPRTTFNDGISADPYPSPDINPIEETDSTIHRFETSGTYVVTLTVTDDDGGIGFVTITLVISL
jgi:PKD repeat protein